MIFVISLLTPVMQKIDEYGGRGTLLHDTPRYTYEEAAAGRRDIHGKRLFR